MSISSSKIFIAYYMPVYLKYEVLETWKAFKAFQDLTPIHFAHLSSTIDAFSPNSWVTPALTIPAAL